MNRHRTPTVESIRSSLDALARGSKTPGIQYLVADHAQTVFEYDGGWADLAARRPMSAATTMMAYSMSKTITAAAVLQLVDREKIGLDDSIDGYVDSPYGHAITVRQLLSHTSGIPNPIPLAWVHPVARHETFDERAALAAVLHKHGRLSFAPGTKYAYSNIGYWLLGRIVERASGEPFTSYVTGHILYPLGIEQELGYAIANPENHAKGYLEKFSLMNLVKGWLIDRALIGNYEGRWLKIHGHYVNGPAFGGLVGTARGFGTFLRGQLRPHSCQFSDAARRLFYAPQRTGPGKTLAMTLGWHMGSGNGVSFFYKEGGGGGFHSLMRVYPTSSIATVVITNRTGFDVRRLLDTVDPQFLRLDEERQ